MRALLIFGIFRLRLHICLLTISTLFCGIYLKGIALEIGFKFLLLANSDTFPTRNVVLLKFRRKLIDRTTIRSSNSQFWIRHLMVQLIHLILILICNLLTVLSIWIGVWIWVVQRCGWGIQIVATNLLAHHLTHPIL